MICFFFKHALAWTSIYIPGFLFRLWEEKGVDHDALPSLYGTEPNLTPLQISSAVSPFSHRALCPLPRSHPTPRRTFTPLEAALILPGHKGAVELLVHCTCWQERVLMLVPKVLNFLWYLWICIQCVLSNLAVQTRQLVLRFPPIPFFPWTSPFWVTWICNVISLTYFQYFIWFWCFRCGHFPFIL